DAGPDGPVEVPGEADAVLAAAAGKGSVIQGGEVGLSHERNSEESGSESQLVQFLCCYLQKVRSARDHPNTVKAPASTAGALRLALPQHCGRQSECTDSSWA